MISKIFITAFEVSQLIAQMARQKRLFQNLSQKSLSEKSGVSYGVIKKFELTGKISLESLLKIASALGSLEDFCEVFKNDKTQSAKSIEELLKQTKRKRGRK